MMPIHQTRVGDGTVCAFTGPDEDQQCDTDAAMHVVALTDITPHGDLVVIGMRTCLDHVEHAIRSAIAGYGDQWWVHRFHEACSAEASTHFLDSYCEAPDLVPDVRCDGCGHRMSEHGSGGCAADDEAAMSGCWCEQRGTS